MFPTFVSVSHFLYIFGILWVIEFINIIFMVLHGNFTQVHLISLVVFPLLLVSNHFGLLYPVPIKSLRGLIILYIAVIFIPLHILLDLLLVHEWYSQGVLSEPPSTIFCSSMLRLLNVTFCMEESGPTLKGTVQAVIHYSAPAITLGAGASSSLYLVLTKFAAISHGKALFLGAQTGLLTTCLAHSAISDKSFVKNTVIINLDTSTFVQKSAIRKNYNGQGILQDGKFQLDGSFQFDATQDNHSLFGGNPHVLLGSVKFEDYLPGAEGTGEVYREIKTGKMKVLGDIHYDSTMVFAQGFLTQNPVGNLKFAEWFSSLEVPISKEHALRIFKLGRNSKFYEGTDIHLPQSPASSISESDCEELVVFSGDLF